MIDIEKYKSFADDFINENLRYRNSIIELLEALSAYSEEHDYNYGDLTYIYSLMQNNSFEELCNLLSVSETNNSFLLYKVFINNNNESDTYKTYLQLKLLLENWMKQTKKETKLSVGDRLKIMTPFGQTDYKIAGKKVVCFSEKLSTELYSEDNITPIVIPHLFPQSKYGLIVFCKRI